MILDFTPTADIIMPAVSTVTTAAVSALVLLVTAALPEHERTAPTIASCLLSACGGSLALGAEIGDTLTILSGYSTLNQFSDKYFQLINTRGCLQECQ